MNGSLVVLVAGLGSGCSGSDESESGASNDAAGPCLLAVRFSGALNENLAWDLIEGCGGGSDAAAATVSLTWGGLIQPLGFTLTVVGVVEGQTGASFQSMARIKHADQVWLTPDAGCVSNLSAFEFLEENVVGRRYRVGGSGRCDQSANASEGSAQGSVAIAPFEFRSTAIYTIP